MCFDVSQPFLSFPVNVRWEKENAGIIKVRFVNVVGVEDEFESADEGVLCDFVVVVW